MEEYKGKRQKKKSEKETHFFLKRLTIYHTLQQFSPQIQARSVEAENVNDKA
jgi:hypothetical protein